MTDGNAGKKYLSDYLEKSQSILVSFFNEKLTDAEKIGSLPKKGLESFINIALKGKRIRGALFCLGYQAAGGRVTQDVIRASLSTELFHGGGLVQDDVVDSDDTRRGVPSLHKQLQKLTKNTTTRFGESLTIFMGDIAMFYGYELLSTSNFPSERVKRAIAVFGTYTTRTCYGQILDIGNSFKQETNETDILSVMRWKSCEYTGVMPLMLGAILAGCTDKKKLEAIKRYGLALGWVFQIQDDILGMYGDAAEMGKPVGNDLREGKYTLLMLHLAKHGTNEQKALLKKLLGNKEMTVADVSLMQRTLKDARSYEYVLGLGRKYIAEGLKEIPAITQKSPVQTILSSLLSYMMERMR